MSNDYQYGGFIKFYPHFFRTDLSFDERMKLYYEDTTYNKGVGMCGCGRSPREDGKCVGFHKLTEQEWNEKKEDLIAEYKKAEQK